VFAAALGLPEDLQPHHLHSITSAIWIDSQNPLDNEDISSRSFYATPKRKRIIILSHFLLSDKSATPILLMGGSPALACTENS
jgi:hypothetical protein